MSKSRKSTRRKASARKEHNGGKRRAGTNSGQTGTTIRIRLRDQQLTADSGTIIKGRNPARTLQRALGHVVSDLQFPIIEIVEGDITFVDLDTHHLTDKPNQDELGAWAESIDPAPAVWWCTHGHGLRLVYCGRHHEECALAAALSAPKIFEVEIKRDSRHPKGNHPKHPGATCGAINWSEQLCDERPQWLAVGRLDERAVAELLDSRGMRRGGRFDHHLCPIAGSDSSDARSCVVARDQGIYCYRCAAKGNCFDGCGVPGWTPYTVLADGSIRAAVIHALAKYLVHWQHAEIHLQSEYPNLGPALLRKAYGMALQAVHGHDDPRLPMVFDPDLRVVQGENTWFDRKTRRDLRVTECTLTCLPGLLRVVRTTDKKGNEKIKCSLRAPLLDRAKSGIPLDGYKPIRFVHGIVLHEDDACLQVAVPPQRGEPVRLLSGDELVPEPHAYAELAIPFPGVRRDYLTGGLAAAICADLGQRPPMLAAVGPTGSGKGEIPRLAASFIGDDRQTMAISKNEDQMWRRIGSAVESGRRVLLFDEFLRRSDVLPEMIALLLQLSSRIIWRRLYTSRDVQTINRAAYFLAAGCIPDSLKKSPEIRRRMWLARLPRQVPEWRDSCGGDTADWRARSKRNAQIANSILTHAFNLCAAHEFNFDRVAAALGLNRIDEGDAEAQRETLRDLYRHCRNEFGDRVMHGAKRYRQGRWVDALSAACQEHLQQLVPDEDTDRPDAAGMIFQLQQNLQMVPWNAVLGIDDPAIQCQMRRHGGNVAIRFVESGAKRGHERINEDLPRIPNDDRQGDPPGSGGDSDGGQPIGGPPSTGGGEFCQLCQKGLAEQNRAGDLENAENRPGSSCSASNASSASLFQKSPGGKTKEARSGEEQKKLSAKTLAELAERDFDPARGGNRLAELPAQLAEQLTELAAGSPQRVPDASSPHSVLSRAGFPPQLLVLDFETYFDGPYSLKKMTIPEYVHDARFRAHGIAIRWPDGRCDFRPDIAEALLELRAEFGDRLGAVTVMCHHAHFDGYILVKRYGLTPAYVTDTLAMARQVFPGVGHKLADLAQRYGLQSKGDALDELEGVREPSPGQLAKLAAYARHDAELCYSIAMRLLPRFSRPEIELKLIDHTVRMFTERALPFDLEGARKLLQKAKKELQAVLDTAGVDRKTAGGKRLEALLAAELEKSGRRLPTKVGKNGQIPALAKGDGGMKQLLEDPNPQVQRLACARLAVKSAPQVENRLKTMIHIAEATGGVMPVPLKYHGCHTGRYSGDDGINLQNLPAHIKGLAARIRGLLRAGDGHRLVIVDAAQIEARVLAWFAGQQDLLQEFGQDGDPYSRFATRIFGEPIRKPKGDDPPDVQDHLGPRRQLGKTCILGLGYQAGVERFIRMVRTDPKVGPLLENGTLTDAFLTEVHRDYRRNYTQVVQAWRVTQNAFANALGMGRDVARCVSITRDSEAAYIHLPSGRRLFYPDPHIPLSGEMRYSGGKLYGGLLVENVIQGIARDILVEAMLALEQRGYETVLTVHDEVVLRVPTEAAEKAKGAAIECMSTTPAWAPGLPLAAEGRVADRYGK